MTYEPLYKDGSPPPDMAIATAAPFLQALVDAVAARDPLQNFERRFQTEGFEPRPPCEDLPSLGAFLTIKRANGCWWASAEFDDTARVRVITLGVSHDIDDPARDSMEAFNALSQLAIRHLGPPFTYGGDTEDDSSFATWASDDVTVEVNRTAGPFVFMKVILTAALSSEAPDYGFVMAMAPGRSG